MQISGVVQSIIFRNDRNGYTVLEIYSGGKVQTVVGVFPFVGEGEHMSFEGEFTDHIEYGKQFKASSYSVEMPDNVMAIERYLASGMVKGVGVSTARLIVSFFGEKTFEIMESHPERLMEIPGIGKKRAAMIAGSFSETNTSRLIMMFLQKFEITSSQAVKIYKAYGAATIEKIKSDPYRLLYDISGVGFKTADKIAAQTGIDSASPARICAALIYVLRESASSAGHVFLPREKLRENAAAILGLSSEGVDIYIDNMAVEQRVVLKQTDDVQAVYLPYYFSAEGEAAQRLFNLLLSQEKSPGFFGSEDDIASFELKTGITFAPQQKSAILTALENGVCVITGGPGTGKTTILNCLLSIFDSRDISYELCAPTGRAAKRMSEASGREARTIHRLLEYGSGGDDDPSFAKNEDEPLDAQALIIDEMSMVDLMLMRATLRALRPGCRLIMVGDADQLMSVGAGDILRDIIKSEVVPVARLSEIFRQGAGSAIITNAHLINRGHAPELSLKNNDFFFERKNDMLSTADSVIALVSQRLPSYFGYDSLSDIQVLCPMKKGETGVFRLNERLQQHLNPPDNSKKERHVGSSVLREGDKVIQTKNNYQMQWHKPSTPSSSYEEGMGVYNGDIGIIKEINPRNESITVCFDDGRVAEYDFSHADELDLAYALSVHKSQGSEFAAVVLPLFSGPPMLMTRNLLYTAVTRARKTVVIVGRERTILQMVENNYVSARYSALASRLKIYGDMVRGGASIE
jgi:exodeoxyribonuclease V alpha subunit